MDKQSYDGRELVPGIKDKMDLARRSLLFALDNNFQFMQRILREIQIAEKLKQKRCDLEDRLNHPDLFTKVLHYSTESYNNVKQAIEEIEESKIVGDNHLSHLLLNLTSPIALLKNVFFARKYQEKGIQGINDRIINQIALLKLFLSGEDVHYYAKQIVADKEKLEMELSHSSGYLGQRYYNLYSGDPKSLSVEAVFQHWRFFSELEKGPEGEFCDFNRAMEGLQKIWTIDARNLLQVTETEALIRGIHNQ